MLALAIFFIGPGVRSVSLTAGCSSTMIMIRICEGSAIET